MIFVSPFTPLFFNPSRDSYGADSHYCQVFASTDEILIEIIAIDNSSAVSVRLNDKTAGTYTTLQLQMWDMNAHCRLYYATLSGVDDGTDDVGKSIVVLNDGLYSISFNDVESEPFLITSDTAMLERTTLLQYANSDNRSRMDLVSVIGETQRFFDWRVPGGFKDDNWVFGVDNEQFNSLDNNIVEVYSEEVLQKQFTLGWGGGVPVWYGAMLNRILSCSYVYFDGDRFLRVGNNTPEKTQSVVGRKSYIFKQLVQEAKMDIDVDSSNQLIIRRVADTPTYRKINTKVRTI